MLTANAGRCQSDSEGRLGRSSVPATALPPKMKAMSESEREKLIEEKSKARAEIQAKIAKVSAERDTFVKAELAKTAVAGPKTMDDALLEPARTQATKKAFSF